MINKNSGIKFKKLAAKDFNNFMLYATDEDVVKFLLWGKYKTKEELKKFFNWMRSSGATGIYDKEKLIGHYFFKDEDPIDQHIYISYTLSKDYWGRGIGSEALADLKNKAAEKYSGYKIIAMVYKDNIPSQKLAVKMGFSPYKSGEDIFVDNNGFAQPVYEFAWKA